MQTQVKSERIIGIDPGFDRTGVGIIDAQGNQLTLVHVDCIVTDRARSHSERIVQIRDALQQILVQYHPERAAVEKLFFAQNVTTAMKVAEARGVVLATLEQAHIPISEWTPQQVKQSVTGNGRADKQQIRRLVCALLKLTTVPKFDDATDALAIALTAEQHKHFI